MCNTNTEQRERNFKGQGDVRSGTFIKVLQPPVIFFEQCLFPGKCARQKIHFALIKV